MTGARGAAPQIVIEVPESVGLVLGSAAGGVDDAVARMIVDALTDASTAAVEYLAEHFTVTNVETHYFAESDPDTLRPHAHITLADTVDYSTFNHYVAIAHTRYQAELKEAISDGQLAITVGYPSPCGWEITGAIPHIRANPTPRRRCPEHGHVVWALEVVRPEERLRQIG